jgi:hypothetical protein
MTRPRGWRFFFTREFWSVARSYLGRTALYFGLGWTLTGQWVRRELDGAEQVDE